MPAIPLAAGLAAAQGVMGVVQSITGAGKVNRLLAQRTAYKTPEEIFKILNAAKYQAQGGYDPKTLQFLLGETDRAFGGVLGVATRSGANPNDLSALFEQKVNSIMKIGAENHGLNMKNFAALLDAYNLVSENKAAEWKSQQDILKDKLQAAAGEKASGIQNLFSAANAAIGIASGFDIGKLFNAPKTTATGGVAAGGGGGYNPAYPI